VTLEELGSLLGYVDLSDERLLATWDSLHMVAPEAASDARNHSRLVSVFASTIFFFMIVMLVAHEFCTKYGLAGCGRGLRLFGYRSNDILCLACVLIFCDFHIHLASVIPSSYLLATSLGYGAIGSSWLCSMTFIGMIPGAVLGRMWVDEERGYDQRRARSGVLLGVATTNICLVLYAGALSFIHGGDALFWILVCLRFMLGLGCGFPVVIGGVIAYRALPPSRRTLFSMANTLTKSLGLILGPLVSSMAIQFRQFIIGPDATFQDFGLSESKAQEHALWPAVASAFCGLGFSIFLLLAIPVELPQAEETIETTAQLDAAQELGPEQISDSGKEQLFFVTVAYQAQRALITATIEVATLMILELQYGMSASASTYYFGGVALASTLVIVVSMALLHTRLVSPMFLFLGSLALTSIGAALFFISGGVYTFLAAIFLVNGFSGVTMGIAEGWGTRAATERPSFSQAKWRMLAAVVACIMRLQAAAIARALVEYGGRDTYAGGQAAVVLLGCVLAVKTYYLLSTAADKPPSTSISHVRERRTMERFKSLPEPSPEPSPEASS